MKKYLGVIIGLLVVIIIGLILIIIPAKDNTTGGRSSVYTDTGGLLDVTKNEVGTTTPTYFTAGTTASSSPEFDISGSTNLALNWSLEASSTASVLHYEIFYSNDTDEATTNWYQERSLSTGTVSAAPIFYTWTPANALASTTYALVDIDGVRANRVKISYNVIGANGAVTLEVAAQ